MALDPLYLDHQATTPLDPEVLAAMMPYLAHKFGNPHSSTHRAGREAKAGVDLARADIAAVIGADPADIIFTSGATESNNLVLRGVMEAAPPKRNRLVTLATEHSCVLETARDLQARGYALTIVPVMANGLVDLVYLKQAVADDVALVSVMTVNNEIGVIQPIVEIAALAHQSGALFHTDAAQAFGKIPLNVSNFQTDLLSLSAHKIYGPKGIGALYVRNGIKLRAQMTGGGQEAGIRSGTLSPALCAGLGTAAKIAVERMEVDARHAVSLFEMAIEFLGESGVSYLLNGDMLQRIPTNLSITFPDIDGARLISDARQVMMSSGSACASQPGKLSHVLSAIGLGEQGIKATIRLGTGRSTTQAELEVALAAIIFAVQDQINPAHVKKSA
jgi:cysteine desulfurase